MILFFILISLTCVMDICSIWQMLLCMKTSNLSSSDCRRDQVSQPQRRRFIGISRKSRYLLKVLRLGLLHISLSAPMDALAAAIRALLSSSSCKL